MNRINTQVHRCVILCIMCTPHHSVLFLLLTENASFIMTCLEKTKLTKCSKTRDLSAVNLLDCGRVCLQLPDFVGLGFDADTNACRCYLGLAGLDLKPAAEKNMTFCWVSGITAGFSIAVELKSLQPPDIFPLHAY